MQRTLLTVKHVLAKCATLVAVPTERKNLQHIKQGIIEVIEMVPRPEGLKTTGTFWLYKCQCGNTRVAHRTTIIRGLQSCGCLQKLKKHITKSDKHYRRLYHVWHAMKKRCHRPEDKNYSTYGGRGIKVCERWMDFANFYNDMIDTYEPGLSIDRTDVDSNYEPSNCKWIPLRAQAKNRRSSLSYRLSTGYEWPHAAGGDTLRKSRA